MVNNIKAIRDLLSFPDENSFYFLEIIKRRKENPDLDSHARIVKDFYIYSLKEFDKVAVKAVDLCEEHNARAYFRLNLRSSEKIAFQYLKRVSELLITKDFKHIHKAYNSVVGEFHADPVKKWVVDLDGEEAQPIFYTEVLNTIVKLNPEAIVALIPTKNGIHIISKPFNMLEFRKSYPNIDIHKDNPTIMYCK